VVDDDEDIREILNELLKREGCQVFCAENGEQALLKAKAEAPDIILLDLMMPVMDGWQFRQHQLGEPSISEIPVVVFSACRNDMKVAGYLQKPAHAGDVLDAVRQHAR